MIKIKEKFNQLSTNSKEVLFNLFFSYCIKGISMISSLLTMPIFMRYFENEVILGVWFTLLSFITWFLNFDLGIGNGLRNELVKPLIDKNIIQIKKLISSAYFSIGTICLLLFVAGYFVFPLINWNNLLNISVTIINESTLLRAVFIVFVGIILQLFLRITNSILYAMQKSAINDFIALIISLLQLFIVWRLSVQGNHGNILTMSYVYLFTSNIPLLFITVIVFTKYLKNCKPNPKFIEKVDIKSILHLGGTFFSCQILFMFLMNTNEIIINKLSGPQYIVEYQVYYKIFNLVSMVFMLGMNPIWSAVTKAKETNNIIWLKNLIIKLFIFAIAISILQLIIVPLFPLVVKIWLGPNGIDVTYTNTFAFSLFGISLIFQSLMSSLASGLGEMKLQRNFYLIAVICKVALAIILLTIFPQKWIFVIIITSILILIYCILEIFHIKNVLKMGG